MLDKIGKIYWKEASQYLRLALLEKESSLLTFTLAFHEGLDDALRNGKGFSESESFVAMRIARKRILATCAGLLEIHERTFMETTEAPFDTGGETSFYRDFVTASRSAVRWTHRTALDFMTETHQGKAFLSANVSLDVDLQILLFKAQLLDARITARGHLTRRGADRYATHMSYYIEELGRYRFMRKMRYIESQSETAQIDLCEFLDRAMSEISGEISSGDHWCTRKEVARLTYRRPPILRATCDHGSCASSSLPGSTPLQELTAVQQSPHDFLGYAASQGLYRYIFSMLQGRNIGLDSEKANYLLICSMDPISGSFIPEGCETYHGFHRLIAEVLRRGGNPNVRACHSTVWGYFLSNLIYDSTRPTHNCNPDLQSSRAQVTRTLQSCRAQAFLRTALVFVENHATLDKDWILHQNLPIHDRPSGRYPDVSCVFDLHLSTLTILQARLANQPEFPRLWELCTARGASLMAKCKTIEILTETRRNCYDLFEQDSTEIFELWRMDENIEHSDSIKKFCDELRQGHRGRFTGSFPLVKSRMSDHRYLPNEKQVQIQISPNDSEISIDGFATPPEDP